MRTARLASMVLVAVGVVAYSSWLLEFVVPDAVSATRDPVAVLLREPLFRALHAVSGLAFLLAGPPLVRLAPVQWHGRVSAVSVSAFGLLVLADAARPGTPAIALLLDVVYVAGATSLVLWWPPGWRRIAVAGLTLVLLTWLAVVLTGYTGHYAGLATRVQLGVRAALLAVGASYVAVITPARRRRTRGG